VARAGVVHTRPVTSETAVPTAVGHATVNRPNMVSVGTIVWLSSELMFFAGLFAMYFTIRATAPGLWAEQAPLLDGQFAAINTGILVSSSITCQLGVFAAERFQPYRLGGHLNVARWGMVEWYVVTFVMGAMFIAGQVWEYGTLVSEGVTISSTAFGSVFYLATGFHGLHVTGGLLAFCIIIARAFAARRFGHHEATAAIVTSYYWHFVDVVWVGLFFVIYIIR